MTIRITTNRQTARIVHVAPLNGICYIATVQSRCAAVELNIRRIREANNFLPKTLLNILSEFVVNKSTIRSTANSSVLSAAVTATVNVTVTAAIVALASMALTSCFNPFAPRLVERAGLSSLTGDQRTAEGVFQNFRYAYIFKDTLTYGQLLANDFAFVYRNYERNVDVSWGRDEEMLTTNGLFRSAQTLDLVWNEVITSVGDSLTSDVSRGFTLTVTFNPSDVIRLDGRVNLRIVRQTAQEPWRIRRWRDESNF